MTIQEIFEEVREYSRKTFPKNRLIRWFNQVQKEVFYEFNSNFGYKAGDIIKTATNQANYDLPEDCRELVKIRMANIYKADDNVETYGTLDSGDYTSVENKDNIYYQISPDTNGIDCYFVFNVGESSYLSKLFINGRYEAEVNKYVDVYAYNYTSSTWDKLSTADNRIDNDTEDNDYNFDFNSDYRDSATGEAKIRFVTTDTDTGYDLYIDQILIIDEDIEDETDDNELKFTIRGQEFILDKDYIPTISNQDMLPYYFFNPTEIDNNTDLTETEPSIPNTWINILIERMKIEADMDLYGNSPRWAMYYKLVGKMSNKQNSRTSFTAKGYDVVNGVKIQRF